MLEQVQVRRSEVAQLLRSGDGENWNNQIAGAGRAPDSHRRRVENFFPRQNPWKEAKAAKNREIRKA